MTGGTGYVLAAYLVVLGVVLLYVVLYAFKIARLGREVEELAELARARAEAADGEAADAPPARVTRQ